MSVVHRRDIADFDYLWRDNLPSQQDLRMYTFACY
uniref:Uncharacterized protein n=1 Tax=Anguilla anguilla TaxID=7936 RepID=A0A0E9TD62_ANGAN